MKRWSPLCRGEKKGEKSQLPMLRVHGQRGRGERPGRRWGGRGACDATPASLARAATCSRRLLRLTPRPSRRTHVTCDQQNTPVIRGMWLRPTPLMNAFNQGSVFPTDTFPAVLPATVHPRAGALSLPRPGSTPGGASTPEAAGGDPPASRSLSSHRVTLERPSPLGTWRGESCFFSPDALGTPPPRSDTP